MWTMGKDFNYQYAHTWFRQMDKFLHYVNQVSPLQNHYKCFFNKFINFVLILLILFFQFGCSSAVYIKVLNCLAIWKGKRKKKLVPRTPSQSIVGLEMWPPIGHYQILMILLLNSTTKYAWAYVLGADRGLKCHMLLVLTIFVVLFLVYIIKRQRRVSSCIFLFSLKSIVHDYMTWYFGFTYDWSNGIDACRMGVLMPSTQPHQYILMRNMQQKSPGRSRRMTSFREYKILIVKMTYRQIFPLVYTYL